MLNNNVVLVLHIKDMPKNEPKIVEPGKAELIKLYGSNKLETRDDWKTCALRLVTMDFTGKRTEETAPLDCANTRPFISANTL